MPNVKNEKGNFGAVEREPGILSNGAEDDPRKQRN